MQVNAICPTVVLTEMGQKLWSAPERRDPFIARTPLGRFGDPVEIADLALYLASPASDLVNGEIVMIEGGILQHMKGFGVHTSMWTMRWDAEGAAPRHRGGDRDRHGFHRNRASEPGRDRVRHWAVGFWNQAGLPAVCSLGLPQAVWASHNPDGAIDFPVARIGPLRRAWRAGADRRDLLRDRGAERACHLRPRNSTTSPA